MAKEYPTIILVRPQMGENIGAAARVMMNFGCKNLRIVAPRDGWPNTKAIDMAVHAAPILEKAKIFDTLEDAIGDMNHVAVTTVRDRDMEKTVLTPREYIAKSHPKKSAIIFGPERSGLTNDEIALADEIISIPVADDLKSLNLAQAVAVVCYEVFGGKISRKVTQKNPPAEKAELLHMFKHLEEELQKSGRKTHFQHQIRDDGNQIRVAATLAQPIQSSLHLSGTATNRHQRIRYRIFRIIMAMDSQVIAGNDFRDFFHDFLNLMRQSSTIGIA